MKRGISKAWAASGAALAVTLTGCAGGEALPTYLKLDTSASVAVDSMAQKCAIELTNDKATTQVIRTMVGSTVVIENPAKTLVFAGKEGVKPDTASVLGSVASGDLKIISWENRAAEGSTATVIREADMPSQLLVDPAQGSDASKIIGDACKSSLK